MKDQKTALPRHLLSKSTFMYGCQCHKRLWMHKFQPELKDEMDEQQSMIFQRGTDVGLLARDLFPGGVDAAPPTPFEYQKSVADTARYIADGHTVIYEAAFQHEGVLCAVDILVKRNGRWYAYEVKSSTSVKEVFIKDAALQWHVINSSGITLQDISIVHLNNRYIRKGELDLTQLFSIVSVKKEVRELEEEIRKQIITLKQVLVLPSAPIIEVGKHCHDPYDCDFIGHCHQDIPPDPPEPEYINRKSIDDFLAQLKYPLCFMDFETWMAPVPECDGHWPYRQIPFQFSVHRIEGSGKNTEHIPYLAEHPHAHLEIFLEQLLDAVGEKGAVLVYNRAFENTILNHLADQFPKFRRRIEKVQERMIDLMSPFRKNYRLPAMQGSYSIKNVLPALVNDWSYEGMDIADGATASTRFYELMLEQDVEKIEATRKALLAYCELDTLAMVKILEKLRVTPAD